MSEDSVDAGRQSSGNALQFEVVIERRPRILLLGNVSFRDHPLLILALIQIAYGGLLLCFQIIGKVYMHHFCTQSDCTCMEVLDTHWVGMFFLVAGLLLIVSANPKRRTHLWIVFSSFLVFAAHAMSTVYLTILSYFETDKRKCDILLGALLCIALGSFAVVCCTILVALAFIYLAQGAYGRSVYDDDDTCQ